MKLHEAVAVTYAAIGQDMTDLALTVVCRDLEPYPLGDVLQALQRCRREVRGRLALADILDRIPGGHPGAEEAWSIVAKTLNDEAVSVCWTTQMQRAFGAALDLQDDPVAARMAFKEVYAAAVASARAENAKPVWQFSLGTEKTGREQVVLEALRLGRVSPSFAQQFLPTTTNGSLPAGLDIKRIQGPDQ